MRVAAIDIGTNSVRLLTATYQNGQLVDKQKQLTMTRLGKDVDSTRMLREDRMADTIEALKVYQEQVTALGIDRCPVFATSAVRDAANKQAFIDRVFEATGFRLRVISGALEAQYGYMGVVAGAKPLGVQGNSMVIDIGGGSTEIIIGNEAGEVLFSQSFDIGAVRLTDRHHLGHGSTIEAFKDAMVDVKKQLIGVVPVLSEYPVTRFFGIGGTATTLGAIQLELEVYATEAVHLSTLSKAQVDTLMHRLVAATYEEKLGIKGLMPKRADIIAAGALILSTALSMFRADGYTVSDDDNLEGALFALLQ